MTNQCTDKGKEVLILENLKEKGYKMQNKAVGVDLAHTLLVMKELGKLHAASILLATRLKMDLTHKYDFFQTEWTEKFNWGSDWGQFMDQYLDTGLMMFEAMGGCDKVTAWLRKVKPQAWPRYRQLIARKAPFDAIIHGDCWINNMFFRYDDAGHPEGVTFLDLQGSRVASVALDLQHFLNLNVPDTVRRDNFDTIISTYYDSFRRTVSGGGVAAPFTLEQLREEYEDKGLYGVLYAIMWLPCMLSTDDGVYPFESEAVRRATVQQMVHTNPALRLALLSVMEEWSQRGLIS
ncbi:hypothetical protein GWK47_043366 [Chionoecetes opilio]|uniref:CHK kinase-like domain-containing protein n=1 Tax=Chionoecetes opilio TaxID=41210 RepID=A0A8J4YAD9_CHIOP|nr:hypothetical protein GWK47_043366 [Chionoecetes opilio]